MKKKFQLKTISLGSEPSHPNISEVKEFISVYKGIEADLTTFLMLRSYSAQKNAGIDEIGVGGIFCRPRMEESLSWDDEEGPLCVPHDLVRDYSLLSQKSENIRSVHESPTVLSTCPSQDDEDTFAEICHGFRQVLRSLRDARIAGHTIHLKNPTPLELELLSGPKQQFFLYDPTPQNLEDLLEHTRDLILSGKNIPLLGELIDQYQIRTLSVCDATKNALSDVLQYVDPDHLKVAGYCSGFEEDCWKKVKELSVTSV